MLINVKYIALKKKNFFLLREKILIFLILVIY